MSLISTKNSTNVVLLANNVFTGLMEYTNNFNLITIMATSDVLGAMEMQFSSDGINIDRMKKISFKNNTNHTLNIISKFFRLKYTNGTTNQSFFRIQTILHKNGIKQISSLSNEVIDDFNDIDIIRVVNLPQLDFARKLYSDKYSVHITGRNNIVTTTEEDIWSPGGIYVWPLLPETLRVKAGGDVNDDIAGTGARTILIEGLDANYNRISETLNLNGSSASAATTQVFIRLLHANIVTVGTRTGSNIGTVFVENTTSLNQLGLILPGHGETKLSMYTIPAGMNGYIGNISFNVDTNANRVATTILKTSNINTATAAPFASVQKLLIFDEYTGQQSSQFDSYLVVQEKSDIWCSAYASAGSNTKVSINYDLFVCSKI